MENTELQKTNTDVSMAMAPKMVIEHARIAAAALQDILTKKTKKVMMNGEQYLEFMT